MVIKRLDLDNISKDEYLYILEFLIFHYNLRFKKDIYLLK